MILAIDTGGTKTLITTFDKSGNPGEQIKFPTPQNPNEYISTLRQTLSDNYGSKKIDAIIIAVPGTIDANNAIIWCPNLPEWAGFNLINKLSGIFNDVPIYIENDAKLAGLYEARIIDPIPKQLLYVTISTGIGTGIITDGHINPDLRNSEGGRSLIEYDGKLQEWQNFAAGKSFFEAYGKYVKDITSEETLRDMAHRMSLGFLELIPALQPNVVVIGGSVGTYFDRYSDYLLQIIRESLPAHIPCPPFLQAKNSEQAVAYGCYYYAIDNNITFTD
jgi:predicted NBD/HSP70 family sugar kinase